MDQTIPTIYFFVLERNITESAPLSMECSGTIVPAEMGRKCLLKAAAEEHLG
ncbi:MAG: hypothetical protein WAM58_05320 [Candidatus Acidiferrum sp.]